MQEAVQLFFNIIIASSHYVLVAVGFTFIYGTAKFIHMTHGAFAAIGAYLAFVFAEFLGFPLVPAVILAVLLAGLAGVCSEWLVYAPLRERKASYATLFIASLGLFTAIQALIAMIFGSDFEVFSNVPSSGIIFNILGGQFTLTQLIIFISAIFVWLFFYLLLYKTRFGKVVRAIRDDEEVAVMMGVPTRRVMLWVFFIGSALAGLSGIYVGLDIGIYPLMGLLSVIEGFIGAIVGGIGSLHGAVLGSFLLGGVEQFGSWFVGGEWKTAIAMLLLIIFLIFRPQGIFKK